MTELSLLLLAAGLFGLVVGSFLNVVIYRVPAGLSVVRPPSACPRCQSAIRPYDNIPVLSWLILRGKCRDCGEPISARYALIEGGTAALFVATAWVIGFAWVLPSFLWFGAVTLVLAMVDFDTKKIPNRILFPGVIVGAVLLGAGSLADGDPTAYGRSWLSGLAYFGGFLVLALIYPPGFGMGDVKLAFMLGMFAGYISWASLAASVFVAIMVGGGLSIGMLLTRRAGRKDYVPFGPSLVVGSWIGISFGQQLVTAYLSI